MIQIIRMFSFIPLLLLLASTTTYAGIEAHTFEDSQKEGLYKELIAELRCLVCQNQNLADSNAELALDLRQQTYDMVQEGSSKEDVVDYMVQRYGDFVLYRPPVQKNTYLLWLAPLILLLAGAWVLRSSINKRSALLDADEETID